MTSATYQELALEWTPARALDKKFNVLAISVLVILLFIAMIISSIELPKDERKAKIIPERIAQFVMEREKPKPKPELEKPKPKPQIKRLSKKKLDKKPLTKTQKKAREKAAETGLLALNNELSDLMDTSEINAMVGGKIRNRKSANQAAQVNKQLLTADAGKGSGGVDAGQYTTIVSRTKLSQRVLTKVKQSLVTDTSKADKSKSKNRTRTGNVRAEEDITIIFDQNKSKLYSIYNRARRKNPGLKGKIVLELTIEPTGKVSMIRIVTSELNDKNLERRLVSRIKQFNFGERPAVKPVTVTYPIEFLPS